MFMGTIPQIAPIVMCVRTSWGYTEETSFPLVVVTLNYYLVRFVRLASFLVALQDTVDPSHLVFTSTFNDFDPSGLVFSRSNSIAPNHLTGTYFIVPDGTCGGDYSLTVITNGISSSPVPVSVTNIQCSN